ncbi:hypothetical protein [Myxococcus xanthus]|uniref:Uncharacterized protein n=1 Tax=Myxococcus xanthus TaxID=34 RepID=A0AAE6G4F1_MYXXA|nr:hypothetical protein [Myxococcus xanthus]QDE70813.1 hypothetical protein BHS09_29695 [Myxococcus xanthus]QDE78092.1 hypothetical protein BHS08_29715 [Myxococcus xanthus]QDE99636.1 hypothetical protein BHS05_29505 [Myxococcus xanthus]
MLRPGEDLFQVEKRLWLLSAPTGQGIYDFAFDRFFACRRPYVLPESMEVVARAGVWNDYAERYRELAEAGILSPFALWQAILDVERGTGAA